MLKVWIFIVLVFAFTTIIQAQNDKPGIEPSCTETTCTFSIEDIKKITLTIKNQNDLLLKQQIKINYLEQVCMTHAQGS